MITLWTFFYLGHAIGLGPEQWWTFPFIMTGVAFFFCELVVYVTLSVKWS